MVCGSLDPPQRIFIATAKVAANIRLNGTSHSMSNLNVPIPGTVFGQTAVRLRSGRVLQLATVVT